MEQIEELIAEAVSSLEVHLGKKGGKSSWMMEEPDPVDTHLLRNKIPQEGEEGHLQEKNLTKAREAHQKALVTEAALEEEIEWLSWPIIRGHLEAQAHSRSWDHCRQRPRGWKRRHCHVQPEDCHAPYFEYHPPWRGLELKEDEEASEEFDLETLPRLGLEVNCFLWGPAESSEEEEDGGTLPRIPSIRVGEFDHLESPDAGYTWLVAGID